MIKDYFASDYIKCNEKEIMNHYKILFFTWAILCEDYAKKIKNKEITTIKQSSEYYDKYIRDFVLSAKKIGYKFRWTEPIKEIDYGVKTMLKELINEGYDKELILTKNPFGSEKAKEDDVFYSCNVFNAPIVINDTFGCYFIAHNCGTLTECKISGIYLRKTWFLNNFLNGGKGAFTTTQVDIINFYNGEFYTIRRSDGEIEKVIDFKSVSYVENRINNNLSTEEILKKLYGVVNKGIDVEPFQIFTLVRYFENLSESILTIKKAWFINNLCRAIRLGKTKNKAKNIKSFFGVSKNDLDYFLSQNTEDRLIFYLLIKQFGNVSVTEAMNIYQKVLKIDEKYELNKEYRRWERDYKFVTIKGPHNKNVMSTNHLPIWLSFYSKNRLNRRISVSKYLRYLIDERKKNGSIQLSDLEYLLQDYNRMSKEVLNTDKFLLPYNIKGSHDTMVENYNAVIKEGGNKVDCEKNIEKMNSHYNDFLINYEDSKYMMTRPYVPSDIHNEGIQLNHCVGTYTNQVINGMTRILFMRKINEPNKPFITIEFKDERIIQKRGKCNRLLTPEEDIFVEKWLKHYFIKKEEWIKNGSQKAKLKQSIKDLIEEKKKASEERVKKAKQELDNVKIFTETNGLAL